MAQLSLCLALAFLAYLAVSQVDSGAEVMSNEADEPQAIDPFGSGHARIRRKRHGHDQKKKHKKHHKKHRSEEENGGEQQQEEEHHHHHHHHHHKKHQQNTDDGECQKCAQTKRGGFEYDIMHSANIISKKGDGLNACNRPIDYDRDWTASVSPKYFSQQACDNLCIVLQTGAKQIMVLVQDKCMSCVGDQININRAPYDALGGQDFSGNWKFVKCDPNSDKISGDQKDGYFGGARGQENCGC